MKKYMMSRVFAMLLAILLLPAFGLNVLAGEVKNLGLINHISTDLYVNKVMPSPDSKLLLIHDSSKDMYLYNISTGIRIQLLQNTIPISKEEMRFSPDGSLCAVKYQASWDDYYNSVAIFNTKSGEQINSIAFVGSASALAFTNDNHLIVDRFNGSPDHYKPGIAVVDVYSGKTLVEMDGRSNMIRQNPANNHVASDTGLGVRIYDGKTGGSLRTLEVGGKVLNMEYSPDGKYLTIAVDRTTTLFDVADNYREVSKIQDAGRISFINDSDMLAIGNRVYFATDSFSDYTEIVDAGNRIDTENCFFTNDGKYFVNSSYSSIGIRLLDATQISLRLTDIRLEPTNLELVVGEKVALKLVGIYSDGTQKLMSPSEVKTSISDFSVAQIETNLTLRALNEGNAQLKISCYGKERQETITVVPRRPIDTAASWARVGILDAVDKGFVPEDLQDDYTNVITRQEFCRLAIKFVEYGTGKSIDVILAERGVTRTPGVFSDTSDPEILAAYALGITSGTGGGKFSPNGVFSREQAATMLMNTCKVVGMNIQEAPTAGFVDIDSASSWAVDGINFCYANSIMSGTSTTSLIFTPKGTFTRQESIITFNSIR